MTVLPLEMAAWWITDRSMSPKLSSILPLLLVITTSSTNSIRMVNEKKNEFLLVAQESDHV